MSMNKKIMVVDDNTEYCNSITDFLELEGYDVVGIHDGFKAIESISKDYFDLVLMDIKMQGMDGIDTFSKLKGISPKTATIIMTAFAVEERIIEGLRAGIFGYFLKPINHDRLFCSIENAFADSALVMIADNNKESCSGLHDVLVEKGYRVVTARDGEIAIQMAKENRFDIAILDNHLSDINSTKTSSSIRYIRSDITIIIIGNKEKTGDIVESSHENDDYTYLERPLDMAHLLAVMRKALKNKYQDMDIEN